MRVLLIAAVFIGLVLLTGFIISATYNFFQRRAIRRLENPMFYGMSRKERREYARELREREQEQYELQRQQDLIDVIRAELRPSERNTP